MNLYGASGHAKVIIDILKAAGIGVGKLIDDNFLVKELNGIPVSHDVEENEPVIISIGNNSVRKKIATQYNHLEFGKAVHPSAIISPSVAIGEGTVVMQGAILQADSQIGKHCIINTGASVDHECIIEDYTHISPHATVCGNSHIGEGTWIGAGATVIQSVNIGKWSVIGAGSVVIEDIPDGVIAVGNPCRIIKYIE
ncbi:MAG: acetyltransferase [Prevotella sp.]|nr:acetyltransferase [Prevotella sp.]